MESLGDPPGSSNLVGPRRNDQWRLDPEHDAVLAVGSTVGSWELAIQDPAIPKGYCVLIQQPTSLFGVSNKVCLT